MSSNRRINGNMRPVGTVTDDGEYRVVGSLNGPRWKSVSGTGPDYQVSEDYLGNTPNGSKSRGKQVDPFTGR
jgi:hypothetical protein